MQKRKKNTEHTRMYIFFLNFPHHYSQQRSAVRSTARKKQTYQRKNSDDIVIVAISFDAW